MARKKHKKLEPDDRLTSIEAEANEALERRVAERTATLRESEERYRTLFENMIDGFAHCKMVFDDDQRPVDFIYLEVNSTFGRLTGLANVVGKYATEVIPKIRQEHPELLETYGRVARTGNPERFEIDFKPLAKWLSVAVYSTQRDHFTTIFEDITERKRIEDALKFLVECGSPVSGEDFFQSLARYLGQTLGMDFVCIDRLEGNLLAASTVAVYCDGKFEDNVSYLLKDTPCGDVVGKTICCFAKDVHHLFPSDTVLQDMKAESYVGTTLWSSQGQPIGLIAIIGRKPLADTKLATSILQLAAVRAAGELERRQTEESLRESEERLELSQEIAHLGGWELDLTNNHLTWSDEVYRIFGLKPQEFDATYEAFLDRVHPDDRAAVDEAYAGSLRENRNTYEIEHRAIRKDTGEIRIVHEKCEHLRDAAGKIIRSVGMVHDITERKKQEGELRKFNRVLKALNDSSMAMVRATDEMGYLREVCRIIDYDCGYAMVWIGYAEDDEAKSIRPVVYAGFEEGYLEMLRVTWADSERGRGPTGTAIRTGKVSMCRNMLTDPAFEPWRKEALKRGYASSIVLPLISDDKAFGALTIYSKEPDPFSENEVQLLTELANDLSYGIIALRSRVERNRAEEQQKQFAEELKRSNDDLEQFAYVASHDLREPLRAISGFVGLLGARYADKLDDKGREYIKLTSDSAVRMDGLLTGLLNYSRVQSHGKEFSPISAGVAFRAAVANLQRSIAETKAVITSDELPTVNADGSQLIQLFQNLISNAIKFRGEKEPQIHVGCQKEKDLWRFSVRDNGIGVAPQFYERIFLIFQRLHTRDKYPGYGIGLTICKKIVERHGGKIWVESTPGQGSTFYFTIPSIEGA